MATRAPLTAFGIVVLAVLKNHFYQEQLLFEAIYNASTPGALSTDARAYM